MKNFLRFFVSLVSVIFIGALLSCEIGLGKQVDVGYPSFSIDYPPTDSIIRDSFYIEGSCTDDVGVSAIRVKIINNSNPGQEEWQYAEILNDGKNNKEGSWRIKIDPFTVDEEGNINRIYYDGSYTAQVVAYDKAGHKSTVGSLSFSIDNTAPVFIVTSPASMKLQSPTPYGRKFSIAGYVSEDHLISQLNVAVYDKDNNLVGDKISFFNVDPSSIQSGKIIAQWSASAQNYLDAVEAGEDAVNPGDEIVLLHNNYLKLYNGGNKINMANPESLETHSYNVTIEMIDNAQCYKGRSVPADSEDSIGNRTTVFYNNDKINKSLLSSNGYGLTVDELKKIINGTYKKEKNSRALGSKNLDVQEVLEILATGEINNIDKRSAFSLNPDASPKFTVIGLSYGTEGQPSPASNEKAAGTIISYTVTAGRDNTRVEPWNFSVLLYKGSVVDGNYVFESEPYVIKNVEYKEDNGSISNYTGSFQLTDSYKLPEGTEVPAEMEKLVGRGVINGIACDVLKVAKRTVNVDGGYEYVDSDIIQFVPGDVYKVEIEGWDQNEESVYPEGLLSFGFAVASSGNAPKLERGPSDFKDDYLINPANNGFVKNNKIIYSGEIRSEKELSSLEVEFNVEKPLESSSSERDFASAKLISAVDGIHVKKLGKVNGENQYSFEFSIEDLISESTAPSASYKYSEEIKNALLNNSDTIYQYQISFTAYDNSQAPSNTSQVFLNVDPIAPTVSLAEDFVNPAQSDALVSEYKLINGIVNIKTTITEDNIDRVWYEAKFGTAGNYTDLYMMNGGELTEVLYSTKTAEIRDTFDTLCATKEYYDAERNPVVIADNCELVLTVFARDKSGNVTSKSKTYYINQESDKPIISFTNVEETIEDVSGIREANISGKAKNNIFASSQQGLSGFVTDDDGLKQIKVEFFKDKECTVGAGSKIVNISDGSTSWNSMEEQFKVPKEEGVYYAKVTAVDINNVNKESRLFAIAVDSGVPNIVITGYDGKYFASMNSSSDDARTISGTVSDSSKYLKIKVSGVKINDNQTTTETSDISTNYNDEVEIPAASINSVGDYSFKDILKTPANDGTYSYVITAEDLYGRKAEKTIQYKVDVTKPYAFALFESGSESSPAGAKTTSPKFYILASDEINGTGESNGASSSGVLSIDYSNQYKDGTWKDGDSSAWDITSRGNISAKEITVDHEAYAAVMAKVGNLTDEQKAKLKVYGGTVILQDGKTNKVSFVIKDAAGNELILADALYIDIDNSAPTIQVGNDVSTIQADTVDLGTSNVKEDVTFNVTFTENLKFQDVNPISCVVTNSLGEVTLGTDYVFSDNEVVAGKKIVRTISLPKTGKHDGNWTFKFTCKDSANMSATKTVKILVDTTAPVYKSMKVGKYGYEAGRWSESGTFTLEGTWTEAGSGITMLEYWFRKSSTVPGKDVAADGSINPAQGKGDSASDWTFKQNFNFDDGENYFYIRPTDEAGNVGEYQQFHFNVDTTVPELTITGDTEIFKRSDDTITISGTLSDSVSYLNNWYAIRIFAGDYNKNYLDYKDSEVLHYSNEVGFAASLHDCSAKGCNPVHTPENLQNWRPSGSELSAFDKSGSFSINIDKSKLPRENGKLKTQYVLSVVGEDYKENRSTKTVTLNLDDELPTVTINAIHNLVNRNEKTNNVNKSFTIQGTNTDNDKVSSKSIKIYKTNDPLKTDVSGTTGLVSEDSESLITKWKYTIDSSKLDDKTSYTIEVTATDRTGNSNKASQEVYVDQSTDIPYFSSTNANVDAVEAKTNLFGMGNWSIKGVAEDDDGIKEITYKIGSGAETIYFPTGSEKAGTTSKSCEFPIPRNLSGEKTLTIKVTDVSDVTLTKTIKFAVDNDAPSLSISKVNNKSYASGMFVKAAFDIVLQGTDSSNDVIVYEINSNGDKIGSNLSKSGSLFTAAIADEQDTGGEAKSRMYRAEDKYGRYTETTVTYKVDTKIPTKDNTKFVIRGGNSGNKSISDLPSTWFNSQSVTIESVVNDEAISDVNLSSTVNVVISGDTSAVNSFDLTNTNGKGSFTNNQSLNNGTSKVSLTFSDEANHTINADFAVNVDTIEPFIASRSILSETGSTLSETSVVNGAKVTAKFSVTDTSSVETSGLKKAYIGTRAGFTVAAAEVSLTGKIVTDKTVDIPAAKLTRGRNELYLRVEDNAGNITADTSIGEFIWDTTPPVVKISIPADGSTVNKTIELSGTATDDNLDINARPSLYIDDSAIPAVTGATSFDGSSWTITGIDTTALTDNANHRFTVKFTDKAGNTTAENNTITLTVNQSKDRPVITMLSIPTPNGSTVPMLKTKQLFGIVSDDDGTVKNLWYIDSADYVESKVPSAGNNNGWTPITLDNSSWNLEANCADGEHTWYFYCIDAKNTSFSTKAADTSERIVYKYKDSATEYAANTGIKFQFDTTSPEIQTIEYARESSTVTTPASSYSTDNWISLSDTYFGANYSKLYLKLTIQEDVAMDSTNPLEISIGGIDVALSGNISSSSSIVAGKKIYTYIVGPIDMASGAYGDGSQVINVVAKDAAGTKGYKNISIKVDNTPGSNTVTTPSSSTRLISGPIVMGTVQDGGSGIKSFSWMVPAKGVTPTTSTKAGWNLVTEEDGITPSTTTWSFALNDSGIGSLTNIATYADASKYNVVTNGSIYTIPLYFLIEDNLGNLSVMSHNITYDVDGGKPVAYILQPDGESALGGVIRVYGSAQDMNGSISEVHLQMDFNGDHNFNDADYAIVKAWKDAGYAPYNEAGVLVDKANGRNGEWYIKVPNGSENWNILLNRHGEFYTYSTSNNANNKLQIRVRAYDNDTQTHGWYGMESGIHSEYVTFTINTDNPTFENVRLTKADGTAISYNGTTEFVTTTGGDWFLEGDIKHAEGIKYVEVKSNNAEGGTYNASWSQGNTLPESGQLILTKGTESSTKPGYFNYSFKIKIDPLLAAAGSSIEATIKATANNSNANTGSTPMAFKIDNVAPTLYSTTGSSYTTNAADNNALRLKSGDAIISTSEAIAQSDFVYSIGDQVMDSGSGFDKLVFYFQRDIADQPSRVYNPMIELENSRTDLQTSAAEKKLYINTENLPAYTVKGMSNGANFTPTVAADITSNKNIRRGGLVKVKGAYYTIKSINTTSGVVGLQKKNISGGYVGANIPEDTSESTVEFIYGQVVDHFTTTEQLSSDRNDVDLNGNLNVIEGTDDGDNMLEYVQDLGSTKNWRASINSKHIADGVINIHVVAFDLAGNVSHGYVTSIVMNHRPRLAKVYLATDLNGNGKFDYTQTDGKVNGEFYKYSTLDGSGKTVSVASIESDDFVAKDKLLILPEFVNDSGELTGNGEIKYLYDLAASTAPNISAPKTGTPVAMATKAKITGNYAAGTNVANIVSEKGGLYFANGLAEGAKKMQITFWDSTDGMIAGSADTTKQSQWAVLNVPLTIDFVDDTPPHGFVAPFFWHSKTHNSLYQSSSSNGHVELYADLPPALKTGSFTDAEKVSGKVVVRGFAYDDARLKTITVNMDGKPIGSATYEKATDTWTCTPNTTNGGIADSMNVYKALPSGMELSDFGAAEDAYQTMKGHKVFWEIAVDTSKVTGVAAKGKAFTVAVFDEANNKASGANKLDGTDEQNIKLIHNVDVVPYITKIKTNNRAASGLKDTNIRSASGKYSVIKGTTANFITVEGFNLNPTDARLVSSSAVTGTITATSGTALTIGTKDTTNYLSVGLSNNIAKSGYLELFVNGIRTLNNINNNDSHGDFSLQSSIRDYENMPNREADYYSTKNVLLNDDRYLRVFDMKDTGMKNGYYPNMIMDGNDPVFGYIDLNGINERYRSTSVPANGTFGYKAGCYQTQRAKFSGTDGSLVGGNIDYMLGTISADQVAMAKDEAGKYFYASVYNYAGATMNVVYNSYAEDHTWGSRWNTRRDGWATGTGYSGYEGDYSEYDSNNAIALETVNYGNGLLIGRYQGMKLKVKGNSTTNTGASVYMAYYDDNTTNKDLIFRTFKVGAKTFGVNTLKNGYSNLPDNNTSGRITVGSSASKYLDLGVTSDNRVVIVYYDNNDSKLKLKYSSAAIDGSSITPNVTWQDASVEFPDYVGSYVSMAIDSNDGIHIAAFDASDSDLVYMYLSSYNSNKLEKHVIDQSGSVGNWTQIKLNSSNVPYISYYNSTEAGQRDAVKLAYANATAGNITAGVDSDNYTTGSWEYMTVPAITPPQGGDPKFQNVCLDFDSAGKPVVGYLGTNLEFGKWQDE